VPLLNRAALYWHTVRHLRGRQIAARLWNQLPRRGPRLGMTPAARVRSADFFAPIARPASLLAPTRFELLGRVQDLPAYGGWDDAGLPLLLRYNLHYFDDLNARSCEQRAAWHAALIGRWVSENPPARGSGWDPFPTSLRIVNWIKWALRGNELTEQARDSLAVQARWLMRRLEHHLLGNHLLANAKALLYAGLYFSGSEAQRWYERGEAILADELPEQILADGGHFELSPMYHAAVLEDLLDLTNLLRAYGRPVPSEWVERIARMRRWLAVMTHPDGEIAFFNDAAFGIAPTAAALEDYAARLSLPMAGLAAGDAVTLDASGYARLATSDACLLCDCAAVGPDYLPGHAHADTLSFELSLAGRRLLVNSGTSEYGTGPERQRQRGTAAHNTVVVDDENSSEVWGGFRVARRARCEMRVVSAVAPPSIEGTHDGYRRLPGGNVHRRRWTLAAGSLRIDDHVAGPFRSAAARFHVHPDAEIRATPRGVELIAATGPAVLLWFDGAAAVTVDDSSWHPRFGVSIPGKCVAASFAGASLVTHLSWEPRA
jgi:uncharacterized heparinase superfamily protein